MEPTIERTRSNGQRMECSPSQIVQQPVELSDSGGINQGQSHEKVGENLMVHTEGSVLEGMAVPLEHTETQNLQTTTQNIQNIPVLVPGSVSVPNAVLSPRLGSVSNEVPPPIPALASPQQQLVPSTNSDSQTNSTKDSKIESAAPGPGGEYSPILPGLPISPDAEDKKLGGKWTPEEDAALRAAVNIHGPKNWKKIAVEWLGGNRSDVQCVHRWQKVLRPGLIKGNWTAEEDKIIIDCMQLEVTKWSLIADKIPGRIGKQCRERWSNHLDPALMKGDWTKEEDLALIQAQADLGNAWTKIAQRIPGRSENSAKNRWNSAPIRRQKKLMDGGEIEELKKRGVDDMSNVGVSGESEFLVNGSKPGDDLDVPPKKRQSRKIQSEVAAAAAAGIVIQVGPTPDETMGVLTDSSELVQLQQQPQSIPLHLHSTGTVQI